MAKATKKTKIFPSVLAYEKKIIPSDGFFYSTSWDNRDKQKTIIKVVEQGVLGMVSNHATDKFSKNLQSIDKSFLLSDDDTLNVQFTVKFAKGFSNPVACNSEEFKLKSSAALDNYIQKNGLKAVSERYAANIANARFLWRNRLLASEIETVVEFLDSDEPKITFNSSDYSLKDFNSIDEKIQQLAQNIEKSLLGESPILTIKVNCYAKMGFGQEVFPSQDLVFRTQKSKILYSVCEQAAYHSQKIGNALRTIDNWHNKANENQHIVTISVEIYGQHTASMQSLRTISDGMDFYTLFAKFIENGELNDVNQEHYIAANLIRGGVFGLAGSE